MYALITGASSGIGREIVYLLAKEKYDIILVARREHLLIDIQQDLSMLGVNGLIEVMDLSIIENTYILFDHIKDLDVKLFINNAGFGNLGLFSNTDLNTDLNILDLNIKAVHILTKLYVKQFQSGLIVNISSMAGLLPTPLHATYSASKSYVYYFSRAVNYELKRDKKDVKLLTVIPGPVKTEFNSVANAKKSRGMDATRCAKIILNGIKHKRALIIPGFKMKLLFFMIRFVPAKRLMSIAYNIQNRK